MTRYKKELQKHGIKLEKDYFEIPFEVGHGVSVQGVRTFIDNNLIMVVTEYNVGVIVQEFNNKFVETKNIML